MDNLNTGQLCLLPDHTESGQVGEKIQSNYISNGTPQLMWFPLSNKVFFFGLVSGGIHVS